MDIDKLRWAKWLISPLKENNSKENQNSDRSSLITLITLMFCII